jgi:hypothetical protein
MGKARPRQTRPARSVQRLRLALSHEAVQIGYTAAGLLSQPLRVLRLPCHLGGKALDDGCQKELIPGHVLVS